MLRGVLQPRGTEGKQVCVVQALLYARIFGRHRLPPPDLHPSQTITCGTHTYIAGVCFVDIFSQFYTHSICAAVVPPYPIHTHTPALAQRYQPTVLNPHCFSLVAVLLAQLCCAAGCSQSTAHIPQPTWCQKESASDRSGLRLHTLCVCPLVCSGRANAISQN